MLENLSRVTALAVTNVTKVAGLYVGVKAAAHTPADPVTLAFAAFLIAGAQVSETAVMNFIEHFFGVRRGEKKP